MCVFLPDNQKTHTSERSARTAWIRNDLSSLPFGDDHGLDLIGRSFVPIYGSVLYIRGNKCASKKKIELVENTFNSM